ncbi:MAG: GspH/FimT family pseudopilin [Aquabacterium sp.]
MRADGWMILRQRISARRPRSGGFTVIELMVVLAVTVILMAVAAPAFQPIVQQNRTLTEMNALTASMRVARAEAMRQGLPVTVCASSNGTSCSGRAAWESGWIAFVDRDANQAVDTVDQVVRVQSGFTGGDTIAASSSVAAVTFSRDGFAFNLGTAVTWTIRTSPVSQNATRCLVLSRVGRLQELAYDGQQCT